VPNGIESIADDEILYRRVPAAANPSRVDPSTRELNDQAFAPHGDDDTGISVWRSNFKTVEEAAKGRPGKSYYVAVLRTGDLRSCGIRVEPRPETPEGYDPAHAELPDLRYDNRKDTSTLDLQRMLVELSQEVTGPFDTPPDSA